MAGGVEEDEHTNHYYTNIVLNLLRSAQSLATAAGHVLGAGHDLHRVEHVPDDEFLWGAARLIVQRAEACGYGVSEHSRCGRVLPLRGTN